MREVRTVDHLGVIGLLPDRQISYRGMGKAGIEKHAPFWEVTEKEFGAVLNVNLKRAFFASQAIAKHRMKTQRSGTIINIS